MSKQKSPPAGTGGALNAFIDPNAAELKQVTPSIQAPPTLRPYQAELVEKIRDAFHGGARRVLAASPTGSGKTVVFSHIVENAVARGKRVAILAHRQEIVEQIAESLARSGVDHGMIVAGVMGSNHPVHIASVATLARRLDHWRDAFDLIVVDEAHHAVAGSWASILDAMPSAKVLGVTATPTRLDGRGLADAFDVMIEGQSVADLISAKHLSDYAIFAPDEAPDMSGAKIRGGDYAIEDIRQRMGGLVIGSAVDEYRSICPGTPAVAFCVDVDHSKAVAARFRESGFRAAHVDGNTPKDCRRSLISALASGDLDIITNCGLISEGVDVPGITAAILLRPTASLALYLQQVGRALRPAPGKERAIILDLAGNCFRHGLPDEKREWSLDSKPSRDRGKTTLAKVRRCRECGAISPHKAKTCDNCGAELLTRQERREIEIRLRRAEEMREIAHIRNMSYGARLRWAGADEGRLRVIAMACGYKPGWVFHRLVELRGTAA